MGRSRRGEVVVCHAAAPRALEALGTKVVLRWQRIRAQAPKWC